MIDSGDRAPRYWALALLLFAANTLSFIDRQILTLLVAPIRADLQISDTQMSLLQGLAFASFYALLGLPLGRLADRSHRPRLLAGGIALWSAATIASGFARAYAHLFAVRMGVAVGEAVLSPTAISLLSDRVPRARLARAIGLFQSGIFVGSALALLAGGWLLAAIGDRPVLPLVGAMAGWRVVFLAVGAPGLVLAIIMLTIAEPRHKAPVKGIPLRQAIGFVWANRVLYGRHFVAFTAITVLAYGTLAWTPTVLVRLHGYTTAQAGLVLGAILLVMGPIGVFGSGWLTDRLLVRGIADGPVRAAIAGVLLFAVAVPLYGLATPSWLVILAAAVLAFAQSYPYGIASASLALVTPSELRGQVTALYLLISNLIGLSLGPLLVAVGTDYVFGNDRAVGLSLALLPVLTVPIALVALMGLRRPFARAWGEQVE